MTFLNNINYSRSLYHQVFQKSSVIAPKKPKIVRTDYRSGHQTLGQSNKSSAKGLLFVYNMWGIYFLSGMCSFVLFFLGCMVYLSTDIIRFYTRE
jgi:uncharacterized membrane protein